MAKDHCYGCHKGWEILHSKINAPGQHIEKGNDENLGECLQSALIGNFDWICEFPYRPLDFADFLRILFPFECRNPNPKAHKEKGINCGGAETEEHLLYCHQINSGELRANFTSKIPPNLLTTLPPSSQKPKYGFKVLAKMTPL